MVHPPLSYIAISSDKLQTKDGTLPIGGSTVSQLQSQEQAGLLDAIDQLRRENIDADIGIPQIVVCGDQSSGKSSLLEAIAQVPFPAGSGAVTMFATELVLRRAPTDTVYASILPSQRRTAKQKSMISEFQFRPKKLDRDEFTHLYSAASVHLEEVDRGPGFRYDTLRIEVSGPSQPHLTLIDLPGLIRTTTGRQSPGAVGAIYDLTRSYLEKPRTIVLAVVSATSDFQVQSIGDLMRHSEIAQRMMGVITKPDGVLSQDDSLKMIELACNQDLQLGLGWHVVRNLSHEATDRSPKHRDQEEHKFFASSVWSRLPAKDLGIESLRQKLCQRLFESIKRDLPLLINEMSDQLATTRRSIEQLGRVRKNAKDCLWYLGEIKRSMYQLTSAASDGIYDDPDIAVFFGKGDFTKLRNLITMRSDHFNRTIRGTGKTFTVKANGFFEIKPATDFAALKATTPTFQPPYYSSRPDEGPCQIAVDSYCELLSAAMTQNRGKNLPDIPNYRDIQAVFRSQSIRWHSLATAHVELCYDDTLRFMSEATLHVTGRHTSSRLLEEYIRPSLERRRASLIEKLDELLWPFTQCHPMTAHPEYMAMPRLLLGPKDENQKGAPEAGTDWTSYAQRNRFSIDHLHAAHVLDRAEAYYEIALDTFVDNIAALAIERVLLRDLTDLTLANCEPSNLSDEELESVAGESTEVKEQRSTAVLKTAALEAVIKTCRQYKGISQSTPQRSIPQPSNGTAAASVTDPYSSGSEEHEDNDTEHRSPERAKMVSEWSTKTHQGADGTTNLAPESPTTPKPSQVEPRDEKPSASPNSAVSSGFRSAKSNGSGSTPLSSPGSSGYGQRLNNATGSVAYRSASRKKHVAVPHLDSD